MCQARGGRRLRFGEASSVHPHTHVQPESREFVAPAQQRGGEVDPWTGNGARKKGQEKSGGHLRGGSMELGLSGETGWGLSRWAVGWAFETKRPLPHPFLHTLILNIHEDQPCSDHRINRPQR